MRCSVQGLGRRAAVFFGIALLILSTGCGSTSNPSGSVTVSTSTPQLNSISPATAAAGAGTTTITLTGSSFISSSEVEWNGTPLNTTYQSSTTLTAIVPSTDLQTARTADVTVVNSTPGGSTYSATLYFIVYPAGTTVTEVNVIANDLAWDPVNQVIYLSLPYTAGPSLNTIQVLDPVTGALGQSVYAGDFPDLIAVSANSKYLYASLYGSNRSIQSFVLPGLAADINIPLGSDPVFGQYLGQYYAADLQASPVSDGTVAVSRGENYNGSSEGVVIYDNGVARPNALCGFDQVCPPGVDGSFYTSIQWNSAATEMFLLDSEEIPYFYFYTVPVSSTGFGNATTYYGLNSTAYFESIRYDATTQLVYDGYGEAINPSTGSTVGQFPVTAGLCVPDGKLGLIFFLSSEPSATATLSWYDINNFTLLGTLRIYNVVGYPANLIRWGTNGLAFNTLVGASDDTRTGAVYLVTANF